MRILDKDGSYNDCNSILDPLVTLNIQTPQVPGEITLNWTDFVTGVDGWRVPAIYRKRSSVVNALLSFSLFFAFASRSFVIHGGQNMQRPVGETH